MHTLKKPNLFYSLAYLASAFPLLVNGSEPAKAKTPPPYDADLFKKTTEAISGHIEFLYWSVQENAIDYAHKMNQPGPSGATTYAIGRMKTASYHCDPGFRIAASYYNAPKYWEVRGQYTHLISRGKNSASDPSGDNVYLTGTWPQVISNPLVHAESAIMLNYNVFDTIVDRVFNPNPHLRLRMMAALTTAWIQQDWKIHYYDTSGQTSTVRNRWHYTGGGIKMGLMGDWFWGSDIYITGLSTVGCLMGSYHNSSKETASIYSLPVMNSRFHDARAAFTAQFNIGPSWQKNLTHNRIEIFAGYEINAWFNLHEIRRSSGSTTAYQEKETYQNEGAIALQGLTTRLTVDF